MRWQKMTEGKEKYSAYLCSREWSLLKEQVKSRSGGVCERCTVNAMDHVHHLTYKRKYAERLDDLQACCKLCHEFIHAKSHFDPAKDRPAVIPWCGTQVKTFYLAGKITGSTWRDEIVPWWSLENHSSTYSQAYFGYEEDNSWAVVPNVCTVLDGVSLHYSGPWWRDQLCHGTSLESGFPHGYAEPSHDGSGKDKDSDVVRNLQRETAIAASRAIISAQMLFAWIDSQDCFGTLVEIGYAKGLGKVVVVAFSEDIDAAELWFARSAADYSVTAKSAGDAWAEFWSLAAYEKAPREESAHGAAG